MDRRAETQAVKRALLNEGIPVRRVHHGHGTDHHWLTIRLDDGPYDWPATCRRAYDIVASVIGRSRLDKVIVS